MRADVEQTATGISDAALTVCCTPPARRQANVRSASESLMWWGCEPESILNCDWGSAGFRFS